MNIYLYIKKSLLSFSKFIWRSPVGLVSSVFFVTAAVIFIARLNQQINHVPKTPPFEPPPKNSEEMDSSENPSFTKETSTASNYYTTTSKTKTKLATNNTSGSSPSTPSSGSGNGTASTPTPTPTPIPETYPSSPPAEICGNTALLNGPSTQPAGSIYVDPSIDNDLQTKTNANPAGTTFWLAPGTHTLTTDIFGQVIPKNNNTYIGAPGAILDGQGINRYAFTQQATNVTIKYLTIKNFDAPLNEGVVNHDSGNGWIIIYNTIRDNSGAAMMAGADQQVKYNCITNNGQYGMNAYQAGDGISNLVIDHNEISYNNTDDWETVTPGCGCSGGLHFWAVDGAKITNNWIHHNYSIGIFADTNNVGFEISGNYINNNDWEAIVYEISYNAYIHHNTLKENAIAKGLDRVDALDNFPISSIYISESGGDSRVNDGVYATMKINNNYFDDNWGGLTLWENADRFCNSPSNTSSGYCTLVNALATTTTCDTPGINSEPLYSDCRWKTQNVLVENNEFYFDRTAVALGNCNTTYCGHMAILSNVGTSPNWSPYMGDVIQDDITFNQNNVWRNNTYVGNWLYVPFETGNLFNFASWQASPYNQESGSTFTALPFNGPDDIAGLQFWFKADSIAQSDATLVSSWGDISGNSRNLSASGSNRPTYKTNILNDKSVVRFNGSNIMQTAQISSINQPTTICVIASSTDPSGGIKDFVTGSVVTYAQIIGSNSGTWFSYAGSFLNDGTADTSPHIFCTIFNGASSKMWVDGGSASTGNPGTFQLDGITVGASGAGDQKMTGDIAEIVVYSSALSDSDLNNLGDYFENRYNITWSSVP